MNSNQQTAVMNQPYDSFPPGFSYGSTSPKSQTPTSDFPLPQRVSTPPSPQTDAVYDDFEEEHEHEEKVEDDESVESKEDMKLPMLAKDHVERAREMTEKGMNQYRLDLSRLYELKLKELEAEQELVRDGTHPEYHLRLEQMRDRKDRNLVRAKDRLRFETENVTTMMAAEVKRAHDTLLAVRRSLKTQFINMLTHERFELQETFKNPYENDTSTGRLTIVFATNPIVLQKRRRSLLEESEEGLADESDIPSWTLQLVKKRRRAGYGQIWIPPICAGLDENEKEQDLDFLKTVLKIKI